MEKLESALGLSLDPLRKIAGEELGYGEYLEIFGDDEAGRAKAAESAESEPVRMAAFWQDPRDLIACTQAVVHAIDARPDLVRDLVAEVDEDDHILRDYMAEGWLRTDLADLLTMVRWAHAQGVRRVRIFAA